MVVTGAKPLTDRDHTLVAVLNSHCHFCSSSLPGLKEIDFAAKRSRSSKVVTVFPPNDDAASTFLSRAFIDAPVAKDLSFASFGVRATPTFVLLDRNARIVRVWVGQLSKKSIEEIKQTFLGPTALVRTLNYSRFLCPSFLDSSAFFPLHLT
jgi:protein-disulfide isomerase